MRARRPGDVLTREPDALATLPLAIPAAEYVLRTHATKTVLPVGARAQAEGSTNAEPGLGADWRGVLSDHLDVAGQFSYLDASGRHEGWLHSQSGSTTIGLLGFGVTSLMSSRMR